MVINFYIRRVLLWSFIFSSSFLSQPPKQAKPSPSRHGLLGRQFGEAVNQPPRPAWPAIRNSRILKMNSNCLKKEKTLSQWKVLIGLGLCQYKRIWHSLIAQFKRWIPTKNPDLFHSSRLIQWSSDPGQFCYFLILVKSDLLYRTILLLFGPLYKRIYLVDNFVTFWPLYIRNYYTGQFCYFLTLVYRDLLYRTILLLFDPCIWGFIIPDNFATFWPLYIGIYYSGQFCYFLDPCINGFT